MLYLFKFFLSSASSVNLTFHFDFVIASSLSSLDSVVRFRPIEAKFTKLEIGFLSLLICQVGSTMTF